MIMITNDMLPTIITNKGIQQFYSVHFYSAPMALFQVCTIQYSINYNT